MKKKVKCELDEMKRAIMTILDRRVSEADNGGSAIGPKELMELLTEDFELSYYELCQGLNSLAVDSKIGYVLTSLLHNIQEDDMICIVEKIYAIPPE